VSGVETANVNVYNPRNKSGKLGERRISKFFRPRSGLPKISGMPSVNSCISSIPPGDVGGEEDTPDPRDFVDIVSDSTRSEGL